MISDYDFDELDEEISLFEDCDNSEDGNYKVWFIGLDDCGKATGYEYLYGCYETQIEAEDAIDEFFCDGHYEIRDEFMIPEDVYSLEITGEFESDEIFSENDVFYSKPFALTYCD